MGVLDRKMFEELMSTVEELLAFLQRTSPSIVGSIIGSSVGVVVGFRLNNWGSKRRNEELAREYMKQLTNEILDAIPILERKLLQLIPDDIWKSVVNSGHLALLPYEAREDLRKAYFAVSKCNYEAIRSRDLNVALHIHGDTPENRERIRAAWEATSGQAQGMAESTFAYLQGLRKKHWFSKVVNWKANTTRTDQEPPTS